MSNIKRTLRKFWYRTRGRWMQNEKAILNSLILFYKKWVWKFNNCLSISYHIGLVWANKTGWDGTSVSSATKSGTRCRALKVAELRSGRDQMNEMLLNNKSPCGDRPACRARTSLALLGYELLGLRVKICISLGSSRTTIISFECLAKCICNRSFKQMFHQEPWLLLASN